LHAQPRDPNGFGLLIYPQCNTLNALCFVFILNFSVVTVKLKVTVPFGTRQGQILPVIKSYILRMHVNI
jgi:hypothetical protein